MPAAWSRVPITAQRIADGRLGPPAEIAPLHVPLADPVSSFTSGDIFGSTGGKPQG